LKVHRYTKYKGLTVSDATVSLTPNSHNHHVGIISGKELKSTNVGWARCRGIHKKLHKILFIGLIITGAADLLTCIRGSEIEVVPVLN